MVSNGDSAKRKNKQTLGPVVAALLVIVGVVVGAYYYTLLSAPKPLKIGDVKVTRSEMLYVRSNNTNSIITTSCMVAYGVEFMSETDHFIMTDYVTPGLELVKMEKSSWYERDDVEVKEANVSYNPSDGKMFVEIRPHNRLLAPRPGENRTYHDRYGITFTFRSGFNVFLEEYPTIVMRPTCIAFEEESIVNITLTGFKIADMGNLSSVDIESRLRSSVTCQRLDAPAVDPDDQRLVAAQIFGSSSRDFPEYRAVYSITIPTETQDRLLSYAVSLRYNKHIHVKGNPSYQGGNVSLFDDLDTMVWYRYNYDTCRP